jgi:hypothetical protein
MNKKGIFGIVLTTVSVGAIVYLYFGFLKPRQEAYEEMKKETKV